MQKMMWKTEILTLICAGMISATSAQVANQQQANVPVFDVIHIDAMPKYIPEIIFQLHRYRDETLADEGIKSCQALQEAGRSNHFTLIEEWANQAAYDAHIAREHTRQFRDKIQPMLGAPVDERLHTELAPLKDGDTRKRR